MKKYNKGESFIIMDNNVNVSVSRKKKQESESLLKELKLYI